MIYVTGDIHGYIDIRKLLKNTVTEKMTEDDILIICGDFGLVWDYKRENRKERKWLKWLNKRKWTTVFADGNHENFTRLYSYPVQEWNGGHVHVIRPKVFHLMRGEIFSIEGNTIFVMGGARSHDRGPAVGDAEQIVGKYWWEEEIPSEEEQRYGLENLEKHGNKVDYVITHCLPTQWQDAIKNGKFPPDPASEYLQKVYDRITYTRWYCGHYHYDIDMGSNITALFSRIVAIGTSIADSATMLGVPKCRRGEAVLFRTDGDPELGIIKSVQPWGTLTKHEEPYYGIHAFSQEEGAKPLLVRESQIIEKSLML